MLQLARRTGLPPVGSPATTYTATVFGTWLVIAGGRGPTVSLLAPWAAPPPHRWCVYVCWIAGHGHGVAHFASSTSPSRLQPRSSLILGCSILHPEILLWTRLSCVPCPRFLAMWTYSTPSLPSFRLCLPKNNDVIPCMRFEGLFILEKPSGVRVVVGLGRSLLSVQLCASPYLAPCCCPKVGKGFSHLCQIGRL